MYSGRKSSSSHQTNISRQNSIRSSSYSATLHPNDDEQARHWWFRCLNVFVFDKIDIYHVLERQEGTGTLAYHLFVFAITLISLVFGSISTIDEWRPSLDTPLYYGELLLSLFFAFELLLRIWSAGCRRKYRSFLGRWMFIRRPAILVDLFTWIGFAISLAIGMKNREFPSLTLKFLPPLQMIRFLRVDRQLSSWKVLKEIIQAHRQQLTVTLVISFMFLITGSYLIHVMEISEDPENHPGLFRSMADTIWFSIITMTTIGFGDLSPVTFSGKMVTTTICLLGMAFWCVPAGIIGSGLAIKVQERKRNEALNRLVPAAASVIRNWWRLRCSFRGPRFAASWKIYTLTQRRVDKSSMTNRDTNSAPAWLSSHENPYERQKNPFRSINEQCLSQSLPEKTDESQQKSVMAISDLPQEYVRVIQMILILKYSISCKKFQEAKGPIDITDVVKENTKMSNRLSIMLKEVQRRLDFLLGANRQSSHSLDEQKRQWNLSSRIESLVNVSNEIERKLHRIEQLTSALTKNR